MIRARALIVLILWIAFCWLPFVMGLRAAISSRFDTIPEQYQEWWDGLQAIAKAFLTGNPGKQTRASGGASE